MAAPDAPQNVAILGMHRSGTSALTGALCKMGWNCGPAENMLSADRANERGYFERVDVVEANEHLLIEAVEKSRLPADLSGQNLAPLQGHAWILGALAIAKGDYDLTSAVRDRIKSVSARFTSQTKKLTQPWILKDPRLCLTLPHWVDHLPVQRLVLIVRNPEEVALSLNRLNGLPLELNRMAWAAYTLEMLRNKRIAPWILVLHSELISNPVATLKRISTHLGGRRLEFEDRLGVSFIEPALVHHEIGPRTRSSPFEIAYRLIADGHLDGAQEALSAIISSASNGEWQLVSLLFENWKLHNDIRHLNDSVSRINKHVVSGSLLRVLRWVKDDPTFGTTKS